MIAICSKFGILGILFAISCMTSASPVIEASTSIAGPSRSDYGNLRQKLFGLDKSIEDFKLNNEIPDKIFKQSLKNFIQKIGFVMSDFYKFNFGKQLRDNSSAITIFFLLVTHYSRQKRRNSSAR